MKRSHRTVSLLFLIVGCKLALAKFTPALPQSFFFDWDSPYDVVYPVVEKCDLMNLKWSRSSAQGPNPIPPYFLQVYASNLPVPLVVPVGEALSWSYTMPLGFPTQFLTCMIDGRGNTGGCQRMATAIDATRNQSCLAPVELTNPPNGQLSIEGTVMDGPFSQYAWIPQCTDLMLAPKNGTPPFIYTISPASRPPINITSNDMKPINWTVSLQWGQTFFVSVVDSKGAAWARGPLHAGASDVKTPPYCLSDTADFSVTSVLKRVSPNTAIYTGLSGAILGLLLGLGAAFIWARVRGTRPSKKQPPSMYKTNPFMDPSELSHLERTTSEEGTIYPLIDTRPHRPAPPRLKISRSSRSAEPASAVSSAQPHSAGGQSHVYVVHHDGGRAPVSVFTAEGTEVVELPPSYVPSPTGATFTAGAAGGSSGNGGNRPNLQAALNPPREPGRTPRKGRQPVNTEAIRSPT